MVRLASRALATSLCCLATSKDLARVPPPSSMASAASHRIALTACRTHTAHVALQPCTSNHCRQSSPPITPRLTIPALHVCASNHAGKVTLADFTAIFKEKLALPPIVEQIEGDVNVNKLFDDMCTVLVFRSMIVYARRYQRDSPPTAKTLPMLPQPCAFYTQTTFFHPPKKPL